MGRRYALSRRLEDAMDLPGGSLSPVGLLEVEGRRRAIVSCCRGVLVCSDDRIGLRVPEGSVTVYGGELEIRCFSEDGAVIVGDIQRIEFTE